MSIEPALTESAPVLPRTWPVLVVNILAIVLTLGFLPAFVSSFWSWEPCSFVGGLLLAGPTAWLGVAAYLSAFRGHARSANYVSWAGLIIGGFALWGVVQFAAGVALQPSVVKDATFWRVSSSFALVAAGGLWCRWVSRNWRDQLWAWDLQQAAPAPFDSAVWRVPRFSLREALLAMAAIAWVLGASRGYVQALKPQMAEHVGRHQAPLDLPEDAVDVCYCGMYRGGLVLEFTCSEQSFLAWLEARKSERGELHSVHSPERLASYRQFMPPPAYSDAYVELQRGWFYRERHAPDSYLHIAYDALARRAYYVRITH